MYVNIVFYGCLNVEIPTASLVPIIIDFVDFLPALYNLLGNTFVPKFRNIYLVIRINYKVAKFGSELNYLRNIFVRSGKYSTHKIF